MRQILFEQPDLPMICSSTELERLLTRCNGVEIFEGQHHCQLPCRSSSCSLSWEFGKRLTVVAPVTVTVKSQELRVTRHKYESQSESEYERHHHHHDNYYSCYYCYYYDSRLLLIFQSSVTLQCLPGARYC